MTGSDAEAARRAARHTVLIVDDNPQNLELLEAYMDEMPEVRPVTATNGIEALEAIPIEQPDLILLDVMMPRMSGFEVCKHVKGDPHTRDIPILMVTALDELGDEERARECGADGFITKPVNRTELAARVRALLTRRQFTTDRPSGPGSSDRKPPRPGKEQA